MQKKFILVVFPVLMAAGLGCARVRVEAPKEAIKVDISMRLDVYQHVQKDINDIENLVNGAPASGQQNSLLDSLISAAYAQEGLSSDVEQAALRRRDRKAQLAAAEAAQAIGENRSGLVEVRRSGDSGLEQLAAAENSDRMIIYRAVAVKNGTSIAEVQTLYAKRLQADAAAGTPIETIEGANAGQWKTK